VHRDAWTKSLFFLVDFSLPKHYNVPRHFILQHDFMFAFSHATILVMDFYCIVIGIVMSFCVLLFPGARGGCLYQNALVESFQIKID
jgi:hypothetical protein